MPVPLPAQSSVLWFPFRLYKQCSPDPRSLLVGTEPTETEVSGRKLGMMYFLWDLMKRFRARSKDCCVFPQSRIQVFHRNLGSMDSFRYCQGQDVGLGLPTDASHEKTYSLYIHKSNLHRVES